MCMGANVAVLAGRPYVEETSEGTRQPIAEALARRRARRDPDSPLVFHRDGIPIRRWRTAWRTACQAAGVPTRFLHDCRRTAARNLIRASVPERVAMLLTSHKSRAVFDRYNIIHEQELLEAGDQLVKYLAQQAQATPRGLNPGFSEKIGNSRRTGRRPEMSTWGRSAPDRRRTPSCCHTASGRRSVMRRMPGHPPLARPGIVPARSSGPHTSRPHVNSRCHP